MYSFWRNKRHPKKNIVAVSILLFLLTSNKEKSKREGMFYAYSPKRRGRKGSIEALARQLFKRNTRWLGHFFFGSSIIREKMREYDCTNKQLTNDSQNMALTSSPLQRGLCVGFRGFLFLSVKCPHTI